VEFVSLFILKPKVAKELTKMRAGNEHLTNIVLFFISNYDVVHDHNISLSSSRVDASLLGDILCINGDFKKK